MDLKAPVVSMDNVAYQELQDLVDPKDNPVMLVRLEILVHKDRRELLVRREMLASQARRDHKDKEDLLDKLVPRVLEETMVHQDLPVNKEMLALPVNQDLEETMDPVDQLVLLGSQGKVASLARLASQVLLAV